MLARIGMALVVGIVVTLACILLGAVLALLDFAIAVVIASFLTDYAVTIGVLAALWHFFVGYPRIPR